MDNLSKMWKILEELKRLKKAGILVDEDVIKYAEELTTEVIPKSKVSSPYDLSDVIGIRNDGRR